MNSEGGVGSTESGTETRERGASRDAPAADGSGAADADGGYVHRPDVAGTPAPARTEGGEDVEAATAGVRGWALVGVVVTCFLVIPGIIYLRPAAPGQLGLPFLVAMLALPMVPAVVLGLTAVWSMRGPREERDR